MKRRRLLQLGGVSLAVGIAGCNRNGGGNGTGGNGDGDLPEDAPSELPHPTLGNTDNPIIEVFEDYGCPACAQYNKQIFPNFFQEFVSTDGGDGLVAVQHRDFVLPAGSFSMQSAMAARAVQELVGETAFWQFSTDIFENQTVVNREYILDRAEETGANRETVANRIDNRYYERVIENDKEYGRNIGVDSTPSFALDGELVNLSINSYSQFRSDLSRELSE